MNTYYIEMKPEQEKCQMTADMEYMFIAVSAILHNKNGSSRKQEQETRSAKLNKLCSYCFKKLIRRQT